MVKIDRVGTLSVKQYLLQKLHEAGSVHGSAFQQAIQTVDPAILSQLNELSK